MSFVTSQIKKVLSNGIIKFAKDAGLEPSEVQLVITAKNNNEVSPKYMRYHNYKPYKRVLDGIDTAEVTFLEVLHKKLDMFQKELVAAPYLTSKLKEEAEKIGCDPTDIHIMIYTNDNKGAEPLIVINQFTEEGVNEIRHITLVELFSEEEVAA